MERCDRHQYSMLLEVALDSSISVTKKRKMKVNLTLRTAIGALCLSLAATAQAEAYTFTKIADTSEVFSSFFGGPAINNSGTVAFGGSFESTGRGIFASNGINTNVIALDIGLFSYLGDLSINDAGTVAFEATVDGAPVIAKGNGRRTTSIVDTGFVSEDRLFREKLASPSINNSGTVIYTANNNREGGIRTSDGSLNSGAGTFTFFDGPVINDAGQTAYRITGIIPFDVLAIPEGSFTTYNSPFSGPLSNPVLNNAGTVAFFGYNSTQNVQGIFTTNNGTDFTTVVDKSGPFSSFNSFHNTSFAINDRGTVAFLADLDEGGRGIFTGSNPLTDKAIGIGDMLFGSAVQELGFFREGLNNSGQLAFFASLADGTSGIFRADPDSGMESGPKSATTSVPEPASEIGLLMFGAFGVAAIAKHQRKKQIRPLA